MGLLQKQLWKLSKNILRPPEWGNVEASEGSRETLLPFIFLKRVQKGTGIYDTISVPENVPQAFFRMLIFSSLRVPTRQRLCRLAWPLLLFSGKKIAPGKVLFVFVFFRFFVKMIRNLRYCVQQHVFVQIQRYETISFVQRNIVFFKIIK